MALRAGMCLHGTAASYHSSGAWKRVRLRRNRRPAAAIAARADAAGTGDCRIPRPTVADHALRRMAGDGQGRVRLGRDDRRDVRPARRRGFTGRPAETVENASAGPTGATWGGRWRFLEMYFKPQAVCRWAQPAVEAALHCNGSTASPPGDITALR